MTPPRPSGRVLGEELLAMPVASHHLAPTTLAELLDQRTTLLVFLRHYG